MISGFVQYKCRSRGLVVWEAAVGGVGAGVGRVGEGICGVCGVCAVTEHACWWRGSRGRCPELE